MLVLLPPSEGKTAPATGAPVDLAELSHPALTKPRERILNTLIRVSGGREATALKALELSKGQAGELALEPGAAHAPAGARRRGLHRRVVRAAAGCPSSAEARQRVLIASALWGVVRPDDRIPAYRLSVGARLPAHRRTSPRSGARRCARRWPTRA